MMIYLIRNKGADDSGDGPLYWNNEAGWVDKEVAWGFTPLEMETLNLPIDGEWEPQPCNDVTLDDLRHRLKDRPMWSYVNRVIGVIEDYIQDDSYLADVVHVWLTDSRKSTVWLRDEIMEPLREDATMKEITASIQRETADSLTNWHNTWMPLDTLIHCIRVGQRLS